MNLIERNTEPLAKPPWDAKPELMIAWVNQQLDDQDAEYDMRQHELDATRDWYAPFPIAEQQRLRLKEAKRRARKGDVKLLHRLYPEIAEFIHPPKRIQGRRRSYPRDNWGRYGAEMIVDDVNRIRELWKANYNGRWKRGRDLVSAQEIVAVRRGWTVKEVIDAIKLAGR